MLYPSMTFAVQAAVPNKDQAYGVSLYTFFRAAGQCVGVAVSLRALDVSASDTWLITLRRSVGAPFKTASSARSFDILPSPPMQMRSLPMPAA
jgi:hypothetical protein